jgi:hypothetical protein
MRSEILGESTNILEMKQLQTEILLDEWVQKVLNWQQADGWIGRDFHGENSLETGIRVLREKGLKKDWRDPRRRMNDLTFLSLLILHYYRRFKNI